MYPVWIADRCKSRKNPIWKAPLVLLLIRGIRRSYRRQQARSYGSSRGKTTWVCHCVYVLGGLELSLANEQLRPWRPAIRWHLAMTARILMRTRKAAANKVQSNQSTAHQCRSYWFRHTGGWICWATVTANTLNGDVEGSKRPYISAEVVDVVILYVGGISQRRRSPGDRELKDERFRNICAARVGE